MPDPAGRRALLASGRFFFKWRERVFPVVMVGLFLGLPPARFEGDERLRIASDALGGLLFVLGQGLRILVIGLAYIKRGGKDKKVYAERLVTEGVFAHSRNPLYLGNLLIAAGLLVVHGSPVVIAAGGAFFLWAYLAITAAEENYLGGRFGEEYAAYCRRVPRFFPRMSGWKETLGGMGFDGVKVVRKEYGTIFVNVTLVLGLVLWDRRGELNAGLAWTLALVWAACLVFAGTAFVLKKTRRLPAGKPRPLTGS